MLLRQLTEHVKAQNWFAVALDFAIVIIGVFMGIQVSNWNESRLARAEEAALIQRISTDFERIQADSERSLAYHRGILADLKTLVRSLRAGNLEDEHIPAVERALFLGIAFQTSADHSGTFTELLSSGRANILSEHDLLAELVAYEDFLERFTVASTYFIDMASNVQQHFVSEFSYDLDFPFFNDGLNLNTDNPAIASYDFAAMAGNPAFINAAEQLVYVHSLYTMWRLRISARIDAIQQRLTANVE